MTDKMAVIFVHHCNNHCPNFYHNYGDHENMWCVMLGRKVYDYGDCDHLYEEYEDYTLRPIPDDCPLEDVVKK